MATYMWYHVHVGVVHQLPEVKALKENLAFFMV